METQNEPKSIAGNKKVYIAVIFLVVLVFGGVVLALGLPKTKTKDVKKPYEEIITKNQGAYIVKNMVYTETNLDLSKIETVMKEIRSGCSKPCKINLYSDRKAYELDIMAGEKNFSGFTDEQRNYLSTHILAFWGIDEGDNIEYYPSK